MHPDLGPGAPAVRALLARVTRLTPDEALQLLQGAAALERAGWPAAAERAEMCLALVSEVAGSAVRDVPAAVWAAFEVARGGAVWRAEAARIAAIEDDPRRAADALGAHVTLVFAAERLIEQSAAAIACARLLPPADSALVLGPWLVVTRESAASPTSGDA